MDEQKCIQLFINKNASCFEQKINIRGLLAFGCFTYKNSLILRIKINTTLSKAAYKVYNLIFVAYDDSRAATVKGKRRQAGTP